MSSAFGVRWKTKPMKKRLVVWAPNLTLIYGGSEICLDISHIFVKSYSRLRGLNIGRRTTTQQKSKQISTTQLLNKTVNSEPVAVQTLYLKLFFIQNCKCHSGPKEAARTNQQPETLVTARLISKKVFLCQHQWEEEAEEAQEWPKCNNLLRPSSRAL